MDNILKFVLILSIVSGTCLANSYHGVTLNWTASPGGCSAVGAVLTYNVYRSFVDGGPYVQISTSISSLSYTDYAPVHKRTYYYVVTGVCTVSGIPAESSYSNQVTVDTTTIPPHQSATLGIGE